MGYQRGEEVLRCQPYSYVIYSNFRSTVCDFCLKFKTDQSLKKCSACKYVYYCETSCQKNAWRSHHQEECVYLRKMPSELLSNHVWQIIRKIFISLRQQIILNKPEH